MGIKLFRIPFRCIRRNLLEFDQVWFNRNLFLNLELYPLYQLGFEKLELARLLTHYLKKLENCGIDLRQVTATRLMGTMGLYLSFDCFRWRQPQSSERRVQILDLGEEPKIFHHYDQI